MVPSYYSRGLDRIADRTSVYRPLSLSKIQQKHTIEVAQPVLQTVLESGPYFMQKWGPEHAKMVVAHF